jgi:hypothetical protein
MSNSMDEIMELVNLCYKHTKEDGKVDTKAYLVDLNKIIERDSNKQLDTNKNL